MSRGVNRPVERDEEGIRAQADLSELTIRARWQHYRALMTAEEA